MVRNNYNIPNEHNTAEYTVPRVIKAYMLRLRRLATIPMTKLKQKFLQNERSHGLSLRLVQRKPKSPIAH